MTQVEALIQRNLKHVRARNYTVDCLYKAYIMRDGKYRARVADGTYPGALRDLYADKEAYRIAYEERVG